MHTPLTFDQFYSQALAANGIHREPEPIEKVAAARGVDVVIAKLAKAVFDQSRLDNIEYENPKARLDDAFKIASAYIAHVEECKTAATKLAADLHRIAAHAVEGYLAQHGVDLTADEGIKLAAVFGDDDSEEKQATSDFVARMAAARAAKKGKAAPAADAKPAEGAKADEAGKK